MGLNSFLSSPTSEDVCKTRPKSLSVYMVYMDGTAIKDMSSAQEFIKNVATRRNSDTSHGWCRTQDGYPSQY